MHRGKIISGHIKKADGHLQAKERDLRRKQTSDTSILEV